MPTIVGKWDWIRSEGGFRGTAMNPSTEGYHQNYTFDAGGHYILLRDPDKANVSTAGIYQVRRQFFPNLGDTAQTLTLFRDTTDLGVFNTSLLRIPSSDTILIGDSFADGTVEIYARIK